MSYQDQITTSTPKFSANHPSNPAARAGGKTSKAWLTRRFATIWKLERKRGGHIVRLVKMPLDFDDEIDENAGYDSPDSGSLSPSLDGAQYSVHDHSREESIDLYGQVYRVPPNTPSTDLSLSPRVSRRQGYKNIVSLNLVHSVDLRALTYDGVVDENLMCPICRCPLVKPITTSCDHTFCSSCIKDALEHSQTCPVDRRKLSLNHDLKKSDKLVYNQLDSLKARCPCCEGLFSRSMLANHLEKYCPESLTRCPGINTERNCPEKVKRKLAGQGCLHYDAECPDCKETMEQIQMEDHRESACGKRHKECGQCGEQILRCKEKEHDKDCPDAIVSCRWSEYGCQHEAKRRELHYHTEECSFKVVGNMAEMLKKEIAVLRNEVRGLSDKNLMQERRIKFLENGPKDVERPPMDYSELSTQQLSALADPSTMEPLSSGNEYLLSLLESQDSKLSQISAGMTELEAKQTTMLFNETIPIKNELAEIRSMQQTTSMHVRWLMRFRIQENSRRFGAAPTGSGGDGSEGGGGPSGSDSPLARRTSESMSRDLVTKL